VPDGRSAPTPILFVHSGRDWIRGSERCLLDLVGGLDRARFAPVVWCDSEVLAAEARALGAAVEVRRGGWRSGDALLPSRSDVGLAREVMRRHSARLVHVNDDMPLKSVLAAARSARVWPRVSSAVRPASRTKVLRWFIAWIVGSGVDQSKMSNRSKRFFLWP